MLDAPGALPLLVALVVVAGAVLLRLRQGQRDVLARTQGAVERARAELATLEADIATRSRERETLADVTSALDAARQELARVREDARRTREELDVSAALLAEQRAAVVTGTSAAAAPSVSTSVHTPARSSPLGVDLAAVLAASGPGEAPLAGVVRAVRPEEPAPDVDAPMGDAGERP